MSKVTFVTRTNVDGSEVEHAIIDRGNGELTSMPKETYETQFGKAPVPIVTEDE